MKICVVGSSNVDMCSKVSHLPAPGETVGDGVFMQAYGGKGANQAVAAKRLGGDVNFITAVGDDALGREMMVNFRKEGICVSDAVMKEGENTGIALIMIDSKGENCIAVNPGANASLSKEMIDGCRKTIEDAYILVMQAEVPFEAVKFAAMLAKDTGVPVLYNPAPVFAVDDEMLSMTEILVVNRNEAAVLAGTDDVETAAMRLYTRGVTNVVVTLGGDGLYYFDGIDGKFMKSFKVDAVDAVGAGDTFCGALAVSYAEHGRKLCPESLRFAMAAAALSVTKAGAQPSIPTRIQTQTFLANHMK